MPDDRTEIPTPNAAQHHSHLRSVAHEIPPLNPDAQILLLLGRDILQVQVVSKAWSLMTTLPSYNVAWGSVGI